MPYGDPRAGVIDGLGYTWCLKCEGRARTERVTELTRRAGSDSRPPSVSHLNRDEKCDGCGIVMAEQQLPASVPLSWDVSQMRWVR